MISIESILTFLFGVAVGIIIVLVFEVLIVLTALDTLVSILTGREK